MTPSEVITALEKALEAGPTPGEWEVVDESRISPSEPYWIGTQHSMCGFVSHAVVRSGCDEADELGDMKANAAFIAAASPLAIRTLLDAHASALRDAEKLREALTHIEGAAMDATAMRTAIRDAARAALDDNTKGAAE